MFESTDKQKQENPQSAPQTIAEAIEAMKLGNDPDGIIGGPVTNGDGDPAADTGKGKGKQAASAGMRSASGHSVASKGKGKGTASNPRKNRPIAIANGDSDSSLDGTDGVNGDDDYVIRTDHLAKTDGSD